MTTTPPIVDETERYLRELDAALTQPRENECLCCYVARLLDEFGCDGTHRHAFRYRATMAPRSTALAARLRRMGACCCDCELFLNAYQLRPLSPERAAGDFEPVEDTDSGLDSLPPCQGVRRGSVQPCNNWMRVRRP